MRQRMTEGNGTATGRSSQAITTAGYVALGAGLMYMLDPDQGPRRRSVARDKLIHSAKVTQTATRKTAEYMRDRTRGIIAETSARMKKEEVTDKQLSARVRSAIGRAVSHPSAIEVSAHEGVVKLRGPVLIDEVDELLRTTASVRGVQDVLNELEMHRDAGTIPGLQGQARRKGRRAGFLQEYWPPSTRLMAGIGGSTLITWGFGRGGILGTAAGISGVGLLARGITNLSLRRLTGVGAGPKAVDVQKTITIVAPIEDVFNFFANYQNFPRFMSNVREVRDSGTGRSHWMVKGPVGMDLEWDAVISGFEPNRMIAWKSIPGSTVENAGILRFEQVPDGTRVDIKLTYNPPAGALGHAVAKVFGADPKSEMDEDLNRVKTMVETGQPARDAAQPLPEAQHR